MPKVSVGRCPSCNRENNPKRIVRGPIVLKGWVHFLFHCPCETEYEFSLPKANYPAWLDAVRRLDTKRQEEQALAKRREIGRMVKGWAIDLEAIENVADLEVYWWDEPKFREEPES